jgi:alpha-L-rhamnosidase
VLSDNGQDSVAVRLLLTTTFPSWLYEVEQGATTTWERWNGDHGDPGMNSFSHYAFGAVGEWLYRYLAGIDQPADAVGFDRILLHPRWTGPLDSVRAVYRSVRGPIGSAWTREQDGTVALELTIPANSRGELVLPEGWRLASPPAEVQALGAATVGAHYSIPAGIWRLAARQ